MTPQQNADQIKILHKGNLQGRLAAAEAELASCEKASRTKKLQKKIAELKEWISKI